MKVQDMAKKMPWKNLMNKLEDLKKDIGDLKKDVGGLKEASQNYATKQDLKEMKKDIIGDVNTALQFYATKKDMENAVDRGIKSLGTIIEGLRHDFKAVSEGKDYLFGAVRDHDKRISKLEHGI